MYCRRSFSLDNLSRLARRAGPARCNRSTGTVMLRKHDASGNACRRLVTRRFIYSIKYVYTRNTNSINCVRLLYIATRRIYLLVHTHTSDIFPLVIYAVDRRRYSNIRTINNFQLEEGEIDVRLNSFKGCFMQRNGRPRK